MRSIEEIKSETEKLRKLCLTLPEFSFFGENNWNTIGTQLDVLDGIISDEDELWDRKDEFEECEFNAALETFQWLDGEIDTLVSDDEIKVEAKTAVEPIFNIKEKEEVSESIKKLHLKIQKRIERKEKEKLKDPLEQFRTRWRRWLGQKCRCDKPSWASLLQSDWSGWVSYVCHKHKVPYSVLGVTANVDRIIEFYSKAIDIADADDLSKLDGLYCEDKMRRYEQRRK